MEKAIPEIAKMSQLMTTTYQIIEQITHSYQFRHLQTPQAPSEVQKHRWLRVHGWASTVQCVLAMGFLFATCAAAHANFQPRSATSPTWGSDSHAHCLLNFTMQQLRMSKMIFVTGGLGRWLVVNVYEVWICLEDHPCSRQGDHFCWVVDERIAMKRERAPEQYVPWGYNRDLQLFKDLAAPTTQPVTTPTPVAIEECKYGLSEATLPCGYGGCTFDKNASTNTLVRRGSCTGHSARLCLNNRGIQVLPAGVFDGIAPIQVYLDWNDISTIEAGVLPPYLQFVRLSGNAISDTGSLHLPSDLRSLDLDHNPISDAGSLHLPSDLRSLSFRGYPFSVLPAGILPASLTSLDMDNSEISTIEVGALPSGLQYLDLGDCSISSLEAGVLPSGLRRLSLRHNPISDMRDLNMPSGLTELELYENDITVVEVGVLPMSLEILDLGGNPISFIEVGALPETLTELYLWCPAHKSESCTYGGSGFTLACVPMEAGQFEALLESTQYWGPGYTGPERCMD